MIVILEGNFSVFIMTKKYMYPNIPEIYFLVFTV